jgi:hypothetical protein
MARMQWNDLDPRARQAIITVGAVEAGLKLGALLDLARRPAGDIRGSKPAWALALVLVNSVGVLPVVYFLAGRRP